MAGCRVECDYGDFESVAEGGVPAFTCHFLEIGDENVCEEFVTTGVGENGVNPVCGGCGGCRGLSDEGVGEEVGEDDTFGGNVGDVVELSDGGVEGGWVVVTMHAVGLGSEVAEDEDCGLIGAEEDGSDEEVEMV